MSKQNHRHGSVAEGNEECKAIIQTVKGIALGLSLMLATYAVVSELVYQYPLATIFTAVGILMVFTVIRTGD